MKKLPLNKTTWPRIHAAILAFQAANGGLSPTLRELSDACDLSKTTIEYMLKRTEEEGIITRKTNPCGRRLARGITLCWADEE
jgi:DNA-binding MarR family transcriptional regulator